ncbi:MAG TPA: hypothetical protein VEK57_30515 [Thermoanaerobaculia bacterium]|nr:hypothetical protein [Thermoanaerobaculia bacterium]
MADEEIQKHAQVNLAARNTILEAIRESVTKERGLSLVGVGTIAGALKDLAATDLYSKGGSGDNYSKNTKLEAFDQNELIRTVEGIRDVLKK